MHGIYELVKIREIIKKQCNIIQKVPFVVNNYREVIRAWKLYKYRGSMSTIQYSRDLKNIFDFHKSNTDHIILYWSSNQTDCLLMCKIRNRYINLCMPMLLDNATESFVATYT